MTTFLSMKNTEQFLIMLQAKVQPIYGKLKLGLSLVYLFLKEAKALKVDKQTEK